MRLHWKYWLLALFCLPGCLPDLPPQVVAPAEVSLIPTEGNSSLFASARLPDGSFVHSGTIDREGTGQNHELFIAHTDATGDLIASTSRSFDFSAVGNHIAVCPDGGIIVVASPAFGFSDGMVAILKLDANLNQVWIHQERFLQVESVLGLSVHAEGSLVAFRNWGNSLFFMTLDTEGNRVNIVNHPTLFPNSAFPENTSRPGGGLTLRASRNQGWNWTPSIIEFDSLGMEVRSQNIAFPPELNRWIIGITSTQAGDYRFIANDNERLYLYAMPSDLSFFAFVDTLGTDIYTCTAFTLDGNDHLHLTGSPSQNLTYNPDGQLDMKWVELDPNGGFVREFNLTGPGRTYLRSISFALDGQPMVAGQSNNYSEDLSTDALLLRP